LDSMLGGFESEFDKKNRTLSPQQMKVYEVETPGKDKVSFATDRKQGTVFRYKPSFAKSPLFVQRYLELTNDSIQYKISKLHKKSLFSIPITEVAKVCKLRSSHFEH